MELEYGIATARDLPQMVELLGVLFRSNLPRLHEEMKRQGVLEGAEVIAFRRTLGKIFAERAIVT